MNTAKRLFSLVALFFILVVPCAVSANNYLSKGIQAYSKGDFAEAAKWFKRAAEQGDATSQFSLGMMYADGQGVPKDLAAASRWFRKAAQQGNVPAQTKLGAMYEKGQGVLQDYKEAAKWFGKAAKSGDAVGQRNLGKMYQSGYGVPQDFVKAYMWYNLAAAQGDKVAMRLRSDILKKMTQTQIEKGQQLSRELVRAKSFSNESHIYDWKEQPWGIDTQNNTWRTGKE